jgi:hypothetical protein
MRGAASAQIDLPDRQWSPSATARIAAPIAVLSTGIVYGTDVFCALVQRPALARVATVPWSRSCERASLRRSTDAGARGGESSPQPRVLSSPGWPADGPKRPQRPPRWTCCWPGSSYVRVSAPINQQLTAAAEADSVPTNARVLQRNWDRVITARATLQGLAITAVPRDADLTRMAGRRT